MLEFLLALFLAAGAVYFVLRPILHPELAGFGSGESGNENEGEDPDDDLSPRAVALRALKEIEFDRATGKLSDADYQTLHAKYTEEALAALRGEPRAPSAASREPAEAAGVLRTTHGARCSVHGARPEGDAEFCSACGRRLVVAAPAGPGFCTRCGSALELGARFCARCGVSVAA